MNIFLIPYKENNNLGLKILTVLVLDFYGLFDFEEKLLILISVVSH